jgi:hypothetical protein
MAMLELLHLTAAAAPQPSQQQQPTTVVAWKRAAATVEIQQQQREQHPPPPAATDVVGGGFLVLRSIPSQHQQQQIRLHRCVFGKEDLLAASPQPKTPTNNSLGANEISSPSLHHQPRNPPNLPNLVTADG